MYNKATTLLSLPSPSTFCSTSVIPDPSTQFVNYYLPSLPQQSQTSTTVIATALVRAQPSNSSCGKPGHALDSQIAAGNTDRLPNMFECAVHLESLETIVRVEGEVAT